MSGEEVAALVLFGPISLLWLAAMSRASYNVIVHNNLWGREK